MISDAIKDSVKKGFNVTIFDNKYINPLLYVLVGLLCLKGVFNYFTIDYLGNRDILEYFKHYLNDLDYMHRIILTLFMVFSIFFFYLTLIVGINVSVIQAIMREKISTFNVFKLMFRKEVFTYAWTCILIGLRYIGVLFLTNLVLFLILFLSMAFIFYCFYLIKSGSAETIVSFYENTFKPLYESTLDSFFERCIKIIPIASILISIAIATRYFYALFLGACHEKIFLSESAEKTKGHYRDIFIICLITQASSFLLIYITNTMKINSGVIEIVEGLTIYLSVFSTASLSYFFKNYIENNRHSADLMVPSTYTSS